MSVPSSKMTYTNDIPNMVKPRTSFTRGAARKVVVRG
jgi:hypothetical protein